MRNLFLLGALALTACASDPPAPPPKKPAPPVAAPAPVVRPQDAPPTTIATAPAAMAEPAATPAPAAETPPPPPAALPLTLSAEQIQKTFKLQQRYFARLYQQRLPGHPGLSGTVSVDFTIRADGTVEGARLAESSVRDPVFDASVVKQVGDMSFPSAQQPTPVARFPLNFNAPKARK